MRILHVAEAFGGGVFEVVDILTRRLSDAGHVTAVAAGRRPETPSDLREIMDPRVELFLLSWGRRTVREALGVLVDLPRLAAAWQPDVIHLHSSFAGVAGAITLANRWPVIYSPHGYAFSVPRRKPVELAVVAAERLVAARTSIVAAVSASEAEQARRRARARRVAVVPNGIPDLDPLADIATRSKKERRVVAAGRPVPQRQPQAAARILQALEPNATTAWVGGGYPESPELKAIVEAGIHVTGWLSRPKALDEIDRAMVYLHWTAWDGLALGILEAMARNVVVIAYDIPPSREVLGSGQVCRDVESAVNLIRRVLTDQQLRDQMIDDQRSRASNFGASRMTSAWEDVYEKTSRRHLSDRLEAGSTISSS